ncbi:hydrolase [Campylobacter sp. MIT 12-5580]|uniref:isochorismatase family protein n=1 Tax=Campylobacter sp. MIT 12-5580 TaxID=2040651 RepID=UPI0010F82416|nr:isochorismatase family protein [Campylobacter sp. MIT 12-5580]TKX28439.1 hydrolase [Campylobacter sp. MIT 12-5580]
MQTLLQKDESLLLGLDIQERLIPAMFYKEKVLKNAQILLTGARKLGIKTLISEQYPKGLGKTDEALKFKTIADFNALDHNDESPQVRLFEKISFSVMNDEAIAKCIKSTNCKSLVFFGIETHICVLQSVIMALKMGFEVWLIEDALSSRSKENHKNALRFMQTCGAKIINTESFLFGLMSDAKNEHFKAISTLIK